MEVHDGDGGVSGDGGDQGWVLVRDGGGGDGDLRSLSTCSDRDAFVHTYPGMRKNE